MTRVHPRFRQIWRDRLGVDTVSHLPPYIVAYMWKRTA